MKNWFFMLLFFLVACKGENQWDCLKSRGEIVKKERPITPFHSMEVYDRIEVMLTQDSVFQLFVEAGENLHSKIQTEVINGKLRIQDLNTCNLVRNQEERIKIHVSVPKIRKIYHKGQADVVTTNVFVQDTIFVEITGSGDVRLKVNVHSLEGATFGYGDLYAEGETMFLYYAYDGTNFLFAKDLWIRDYGYISSGSIGHGYVSATGGIEVEFRSSGNLYFRGSPVYVKTKELGKGKAIEIE